MVASYQRTNHVFPCSHNVVYFKPGVCIFCISFSHCPDDVLLSGNILFDKGNNPIMFLQLLLEHLLLILVTTPGQTFSNIIILNRGSQLSLQLSPLAFHFCHFSYNSTHIFQTVLCGRL